MARDNFWENVEEAQEVLKRRAQLQPPADRWQKLWGQVEEAVSLLDLAEEAADTEVLLEAPRQPETERSHVKLVAGDPPMLRLEINLYSWERGDSEIEVVLPHGGELSDLLHWALPEQRLVICGNLRARIHEELAEVFNVLQEPSG